MLDYAFDRYDFEYAWIWFKTYMHDFDRYDFEYALFSLSFQGWLHEWNDREPI